jgi:hypothetical protein
MAAQGAPLPSGPPAHSDIRDEAAYAIGYQAGLIEGQRIGAERERAALLTEESIEERCRRIVARTMYPVTDRAVDRVTAATIYAFGAAILVGVAVLIWRLLRWI